MASRNATLIADERLFDHERRRAQNYPLSRWYLRPAAQIAASWLDRAGARPLHLTLLGLAIALGAGIGLLAAPARHAWWALLVLAAWFCDRADGLLARRQRAQTARGAWLDANIDELIDLGLHAALAAAAARVHSSPLPYGLLIAFLAGKYLFMYGLQTDESHGAGDRAPSWDRLSWGRWLYHLPANADVRVHLLAAALLTGCFATELALLALYYNLRWLLRYPIVYRRLGAAHR
jgi:phosphatidylglycerophosphate synthase